MECWELYLPMRLGETSWCFLTLHLTQNFAFTNFCWVWCTMGCGANPVFTPHKLLEPGAPKFRRRRLWSPLFCIFFLKERCNKVCCRNCCSISIVSNGDGFQNPFYFGWKEQHRWFFVQFLLQDKFWGSISSITIFFGSTDSLLFFAFLSLFVAPTSGHSYWLVIHVMCHVSGQHQAPSCTVPVFVTSLSDLLFSHNSFGNEIWCNTFFRKKSWSIPLGKHLNLVLVCRPPLT